MPVRERFGSPAGKLAVYAVILAAALGVGAAAGAAFGPEPPSEREAPPAHSTDVHEG